MLLPLLLAPPAKPLHCGPMRPLAKAKQASQGQISCAPVKCFTCGQYRPVYGPRRLWMAPHPQPKEADMTIFNVLIASPVATILAIASVLLLIALAAFAVSFGRRADAALNSAFGGRSAQAGQPSAP